MTGTDEDDPLMLFGFTAEQADALWVVWRSPLLGDLLDPVSFAIHDGGGSPNDAVDYIHHAIEPGVAGIYFIHEFTGHQVHLVETNPDAQYNLYSRDRKDVLDFLDVGPPRDFIVNVLRVAKSPEEADWYLHRYRQAANGTPVTTDNGTDTLEDILAEVDTISMHLPSLECHCPWP